MPSAIVERCLFVAIAVLAANAAETGGTTAAAFEVKLTPQQKIEQALSRLTFGPRPGDIDEVRKLGLEKWIDLQLHPERISENPALDGKLQPLETLRMESAEIFKEYF